MAATDPQPQTRRSPFGPHLWRWKIARSRSFFQLFFNQFEQLIHLLSITRTVLWWCARNPFRGSVLILFAGSWWSIVHPWVRIITLGSLIVAALLPETLKKLIRNYLLDEDFRDALTVARWATVAVSLGWLLVRGGRLYIGTMLLLWSLAWGTELLAGLRSNWFRAWKDGCRVRRLFPSIWALVAGKTTQIQGAGLGSENTIGGRKAHRPWLDHPAQTLLPKIGPGGRYFEVQMLAPPGRTHERFDKEIRDEVGAAFPEVSYVELEYANPLIEHTSTATVRFWLYDRFGEPFLPDATPAETV